MKITDRPTGVPTIAETKQLLQSIDCRFKNRSQDSRSVWQICGFIKKGKKILEH